MSQPASTIGETSQATFDSSPLPDGWRRMRLVDASRVVSGSTPSSSVAEYWNGEINWITPTDLGKLKEIHITSSARKITEKGYDNCRAEIVPIGSVVLSSRAPIGHLGIAAVPLCTNQGCKSFVPSENVDSTFLYYALKQSVPLLQALGSGATFAEVSKTQLENFKIGLPPLPEQKRIATILKEQMAAVERARAAAEAQLKAAKDLPAAYLREVFESSEAQQWQEKKIGEVCAVTKLAGFEYTKYIKYVPDGEYIALRAQNVRNEGLDLRNVVRISREVASVLSRSKLDKNDVVMTFIGANIGEATWVDESDTFYCAPNIAKISPNPEFVDHRFLALAIQSRTFQKQIQAINASTAQQSLSMRDIRNFIVPVPSLEKQRHIAARLLEYRLSAKLLREKLQEQLDAIYPLPATLLRQAFTGKL